jgi:hypothetical protein
MKKDKNLRTVWDRERQDQAMRRFAKTVPSDEFNEALLASTEQRYQDLLRARLDPIYKDVSFAVLCKKFNISLQDADDLWRSHQLHTGMMEAMNHYPRVIKDIAEDSYTRMTACSRCDGEGVVSVNTNTNDGEIVTKKKVCPQCEGEKKVRSVGDKGSRDHYLEAVGVIGKKVPSNAIQMNFGLDMDLSDVLMMSQKVINGEQKS